VTIPAVVFQIGPDLYAVATSAVREVVDDPRLTSLPTAPAILLGAFNLRGAVIPVFDTAAVLGLARISEASAAVVVNTTAGPAALVADGLPTYAELGAQVGQSTMRGALGLYDVADSVVVLLDVEEMLLGQRAAHAADASPVAYS
jgi:chemotaxis signal transduction protein